MDDLGKATYYGLGTMPSSSFEGMTRFGKLALEERKVPTEVLKPLKDGWPVQGKLLVEQKVPTGSNRQF